MRVGEAVVELLREHGVDTVFGIPGVHTIELYRGIALGGMTAITARSEQGAGLMADGYARVTGRPGVCIVVSGPGVTNVATAVGQAFHDSIPLLVIAAGVRRDEMGRGYGPLHDLPDQAAVLRPMTARSTTVASAEELPGLLDEAWRVFSCERPRPVHLTIPVDLLEADWPSQVPVAAARLTACRPAPDPEAVRAAAALLASARRPVVILGGGAVDAGAQALALARRLDAPVAVTGNARGVIPHDDPLCLGSTLPLGTVADLVAAADVALLCGTELSPVDTMYSGRRLAFGGRVVRVDIDPEQIAKKVAPAVGIVADAGRAMAALDAAIGTQGAIAPAAAGREPGAARVAGALGAATWDASMAVHDPWIAALDAALPRDRIVAIDSTQLAYTAHHRMPCWRPRSWLAPYGWGSLGTALPNAIGAAIAAPDRPVVAIAGDGGLLFTIGEMATAVDLGRPLLLLVWDNRGYGEIRDAFDRASAPRIGTETTAADPLAIARGFGWRAEEARDPSSLGPLVRRALGGQVPTMLLIRTPR